MFFFLNWRIVLVGVRPELDLLDVDQFLLLAGVVGLLALLIEELAVVHDPADGRGGVGRDLHQVEIQRLRPFLRLLEGEDAGLVSLLVDQPDLDGPDFLVDAGPRPALLLAEFPEYGPLTSHWGSARPPGSPRNRLSSSERIGRPSGRRTPGGAAARRAAYDKGLSSADQPPGPGAAALRGEPLKAAPPGSPGAGKTSPQQGAPGRKAPRLLALEAVAHGERPRLGLPRPGHQHVGGPSASCASRSAVVQLLVALVQLHPESPGRGAPSSFLPAVGGGTSGEGEEDRLHRGQPEGEGPGVVLDQRAEEALQATRAGRGGSSPPGARGSRGRRRSGRSGWGDGRNRTGWSSAATPAAARRPA